MENFCDIILVTYFGNAILNILMTDIIIEVRFRHNQFEKPQFCQITQLQVTNIEG